MKRKHLALLLAAAMTVTSVDATALVSAADFSTEVTEEAVQDEEIVQSEEDTAVDVSDEETNGEDEVPAVEEESPAADFSSDVQEDFSAEAGDGNDGSITIPSTGVTTLELDKSYQVDITTEKREQWFSFTPTVDEDYIFTSYDNNEGEVDPKGYLYDAKGNSIASDDDCDGYGFNFRIVYSLKAGNTYYYKATVYGNEDDEISTGSYTVSLTIAPKLETLTYEALTLTTTWGEETSVNGLLDGKLKGSATDGETYEMPYLDIVAFRDGYEFNDVWGKVITFHVIDANGERVVPERANVDELNADEWVKPGQYTYWFEYNQIKTNPVTITIEAPSYPTVKLGKTDFVSEGTKWVSFTPEETGYYQYKVENSKTNTYLGYAYYMASNGMKVYPDSDSEEESDFLKKGVTYYIPVQGYVYDEEKPVKEQVTISINRFKPSTCTYTTATIPATCTTDGKTVETCQTHEGETITTVIPKKGHTPGEWTVAQEATALAAGTSVQKCTTCGAVINTQTIAKLPATLALNVTAKKTVPMKVKQSFAVKASGLAKGDGVKSWTSSNKKVVTVASNGKLTAKKTGTATITVTLKSGYTTWFKVKVQKKEVTTTSLKVLNKATGKNVAKKVTLKRKGKLNLSAVVAPVTSRQKVTYSSSNKKVVAVNSKGVVTAKKKGKATITVKSGKKAVKIQITVK